MSDSERQVEIPWLLEKVKGAKKILDIGSMDARYVGPLTELVEELWLVDPLLEPSWAPAGASVHAGKGHSLPKSWGASFDVACSVSALDHIGLNAYGQTAEDGLLEATVTEVWRVLREGGRFLVTVPFGRDHVTTHPGGDQRIFDMAALAELFPARRWKWASMTFWKLENDEYIETGEEEVTGAEYAQWRAAAVIGLELVKRRGGANPKMRKVPENKMMPPAENKEPAEVEATDAAVALAEENGIDLAAVKGTGAGGRILVADVEAAIEKEK